ncbi:MAG: sugar ABC transporter ATP-binding protein, partial [Deinococcus sp.]
LGATYPSRGGLVDWRAMRREAQAAQAPLGLDLPLDELAQRLTPTQATLSELLRAVLVRSRLLIMDEPSASLSHSDTRTLFALIRRLRAEGTAVLYVSHRLEEVLDLADEVSVLRGGELAAHFRRGEADAGALLAAMSGQGREERAPTAASTPLPGGPTLLEVGGLSTRDGRVRDVSFELRPGEVLGVYGLAGAGRSELLEALAGLRPLRGGSLRWGSGARSRVVLIPEDRRGQGMVAHLSLRENATLSTLEDHARWGLMSGPSERRAVTRAIEALGIRASGPEQPIGELSGGNQQKVVFARALAEQPEVWLCDEPTQAVDVLTRRAIHALLREQAASGAGVVFVTSDLGELLEVADRALVLREGRGVATLSGVDLNAQAVLRACYGSAVPDGEASLAGV